MSFHIVLNFLDAQANPLPEDYSQYYNFNSFAMTLNEKSEADRLAPTDCRNRPDIRALEVGD